MNNIKNNSLYQKGLETLNKIHGGHAGKSIIDDMQEISPDYAQMAIEWGFGEVINRPGLDLKTREIAMLASCISLGHAVPQLKAHIEAALNVGVTRTEVVETIIQIAFYAGFPAATNAMYIAKEVFAADNLAV
jgi:4-carboxymuconolactone decarboxylase